MGTPLDIAVVGIGCVFPDAADPQELWERVRSGHCAAREVAPARWGIVPRLSSESTPGEADTVASLQACIVERIPLEYVPENLRHRLGYFDPAFHFALAAGCQAWAAVRTAALQPERVGVILGNIVLPTETTTSWTLKYAEALRLPDDMPPGWVHRLDPLNRRAAGGPALLLAQTLGVKGRSFTLDAACASSLYAIKLAIDELLTDRADAMVTGGVSRPDLLFCQMGFSALRALSRRGVPAPFDAGADGLVVGEGAGILILKRLADALRDGDEILAVIRGAGLSNDREGKLLAPSSEGQLRAMQQAYRQAGWSPADVDLLECHATGTPLGDEVEFASLMALWHDQPQRTAPAVLGSCKSNFGHTLTAAGAAGIIKVIQAMRHRVLPPTANFVKPQAGIPLSSSPFTILPSAIPWPHPHCGAPRRAAVSAFGFGGINAHLLLEEHASKPPAWSLGVAVNIPIAVVGIGLRVDGLETLADAAEALVKQQRGVRPVRPTVALDAAAFRLPPNEVDSMLPQQVVMLAAAQAAGEGVRRLDYRAERTGIFLAVELDWNTTNFAVRWHEKESGRREAAGPPLTAERTLGALASIIASRLARTWRAGGPCFTLAGDDQAALQALSTAVDLLRRGEIDQALVGSVELGADPREAICAGDSGVAKQAGDRPDGALALWLKRLPDAQDDGDTVFALIDGKVDKKDHLSGDSEFSAWQLAGGLNGPLMQLVAAALARYHRAKATPDALRQEGTEPAVIPWVENGSRIRRELVIPQIRISLHASPSARALPSCQPKTIFVAVGCSPEETERELQRLLALAQHSNLRSLAPVWHQDIADRKNSPYRIVIAAHDAAELRQKAVSARPVACSSGGLALVYPGSGNGWPGLGQRLLLSWPDILADWEQRWSNLADHWQRSHWSARELDDLCLAAELMQQVTFGALVTEAFERLGVRANAAFGFSLGETTALVALKVWPNRDELARRLQSSRLFQDQLAGPCLAARRAWGLGPDERVDWQTWLVRAPEEELVDRLAACQRVYLLARTAPGEFVVGGDASAIRSAIAPRWSALPIRSGGTVHCPVAALVAEEYHAFHFMPVAPRPDVVFYSTASGKPLEQTSAAAAAAVTASAVQTVDFRRVVEQAYQDGIRTFLEVGPGASCTRMIEAILNGSHYSAFSAQPMESADLLVEVACKVLALGHGWPLIKSNGEALNLQVKSPSGLIVEVPRYRALTWLGLAANCEGVRTAKSRQAGTFRVASERQSKRITVSSTSMAEAVSRPEVGICDQAEEMASLTPLLNTLRERAAAHAEYFNFQERCQQAIAAVANMAVNESFTRFKSNSFVKTGLDKVTAGSSIKLDGQDSTANVIRPSTAPTRVFLDRAGCLEFARGRIGKVLGADFAHIDSFPTRVRLPDEPLMLVDRILIVEGEPRSLRPGRVVTEHDVLPGAWYLDGGRIPTSISVEAGQADLFLAGYLGIDDRTQGKAVYRLLDAVVTFHDRLPQPGQTVCYDIRINQFYQQGDTHLFRFQFDATVNGRPLLTMRDGCAGFFTAAALAAGRGIVAAKLSPRPTRGFSPQDTPVMPPRQLSEAEVAAIYAGDLRTGLGPRFADLPFSRPATLPAGRLKLVDRVLEMSLSGGRFGQGLIRAEADVLADAWYLVCHFVDDQVMPGTLMYECCLHTLRLFLLSIGWVGEEGQTWAGPIPGLASRLKCRGQVTANTQHVIFEIHLRELGLEPVAFAIADALIYADGKPIVEITDMGLRLEGITRSTLQRLWGQTVTRAASAAALGCLPCIEQVSRAGLAAASNVSQARKRKPLFDRNRILAFAIGKPSEAFGPPYAVFDHERVIARLPGPPYQFLDRIVHIAAEPWRMQAGGEIEAEYDVPPDAWYFAANRQPVMPFAVLLEVALQPCGWLAAYLGSALTSPVDLSFRNLGGWATVHDEVTPNQGTLMTSVRITQVSASAGMIIQHYDFSVRHQTGPVLSGQTYFGFFSKSALAEQVGLRETVPVLETRESYSQSMPRYAPFPADGWRMIDVLEVVETGGGPHGWGGVRGLKDVDPHEWFFAAHFYQDPVMPGSLGLEAFLQLAKVWAWKRWRGNDKARFITPEAGKPFRWTYRGQVIPTCRQVQVQAVVKAVDDDRRALEVDGHLSVDGRLIYSMQGFTLRLGS